MIIIMENHISGITEVSTQSDSYNMDTIQVFVAYAHTTMTVDISWDISLGVDIADSSISFSLSPDCITRNDGRRKSYVPLLRSLYLDGVKKVDHSDPFGVIHCFNRPFYRRKRT